MQTHWVSDIYTLGHAGSASPSPASGGISVILGHVFGHVLLPFSSFLVISKEWIKLKSQVKSLADQTCATQNTDLNFSTLAAVCQQQFECR